MEQRSSNISHYDSVVIGAGTAGMESALSLADMGYKVLLVEKEPSVGGKTILLSKVFPTLDCASCISTPKMAAVAHHPNIDLKVFTEVDNIEKLGKGDFLVTLKNKATNVDFKACTGCAKCEEACTVAFPDQYNYGLIARRAAHIAFPQAVPKKAIIERRGTAPCLGGCPSGVKASGFVSLVRSGKYEEAFNLHLQDAPLVGSLSRACYAPCEGECSRQEYEGAINIRAIKRFMVDRYYDKHKTPEYGKPEKSTGKKVAVVGSGPAGLGAAYHLALKGHAVTIFESEEKAGGMLRHGIPSYRLPKELLDRDIMNITALGVEIKTGHPIASLSAIRKDYDAIFLGVGGNVPKIVRVEGKDLVDFNDCMDFLKKSRGVTPASIKNKHIVVIGGGNVAIDVARSALRLDAASVSIICLESRDKMPAHDFEIEDALDEGVVLYDAGATTRIYSLNGKTKIEFKKVTEFSVADGRFTLRTEEGSEKSIMADVVVLSVGLAPSSAPFSSELNLNENKTIQADKETLETSVEGVFAGGEVATGPSLIVAAMGQGKRAAHFIDQYLAGEIKKDSFPENLPVVEKSDIARRTRGLSHVEPFAVKTGKPKERVQSFESYEECFTETEARMAASRCLDCAVCSQCQECIKACPPKCIDFSMKEKVSSITANSVIVATGYKIMDPAAKELLGYGRYANVISSPQMDRLLAPTRPYNGVLRPSDGKEPDNIAMVLCNGSRDQTLCNPLCCRIGCMYSIKQAQLLMGALPLADITLYYIDIRAFGKGYDEFFEQAKGMGVKFKKAKAARIDESENGNLVLYYEDMENGSGLQKAKHDLVVLTVGLQPNSDAEKLFKNETLKLDAHGYVNEEDGFCEPARTSISGVFAAGTAVEGADIPDTVVHSGAAAAQASAYMELNRRKAGHLSAAGSAR